MGSLRSNIILFLFLAIAGNAWSQCEPMEPGFRFLSSSKGCAPFNLQIQASYYESTAGTKYYINWGDGSPIEEYTQAVSGQNNGPVFDHIYPLASQECYYEMTIEAENECNPRGSVQLEPIFITVWTNDVLNIDPGTFRVCQGFASTMEFTDISDWNCFPHENPARENRAPRWIQWIYGTGDPANQISDVTVGGIVPGVFPYNDPAPGNNPLYPVLAPGEQSLPLSIPVTAPGDIGKEFEVTLKNWNQCNAYDENLANGTTNPADLVNGDNAPQTRTARIVIVDAPQPAFLTRVGNAGGAARSFFCVGEDIFFDNETPAIAGADFTYTWEFFDNTTGTGSPVSTSKGANPTYAFTSGGQKLIRLFVRDDNAIGDCEALAEAIITISPSLVATIQVTDFNGNVIVPDFCQEPGTTLTNFEVRFNDVSPGVATPGTQWRWEFYDASNSLVLEFPAGGGYSPTASPSIDRLYSVPGIYRTVLKIRDNLTDCETEDEVEIRIFRQPEPAFTFSRVCQGDATTFEDESTLTPIGTEQIVSYEWDLDYDGITFTKDPSLDGLTTFDHTFLTAGAHRVALQITTDQGSCSSLIDHTVMVDPLPVANFIPDVTSGCSKLDVTFTNTSVGQAEIITEYVWEVDGGAGFQVVASQDPQDPTFTNTYLHEFRNTGTADKIFQIRLRAISEHDCETISSPVEITVNPSPPAGFISMNYSPFDTNCSPVTVEFNVDQATQDFNPSEYFWTISDDGTVVDQISTGTTPSLEYEFSNTSQSLKDYNVTLEARLATSCFGDSTRVIRVSPVPSSAFQVETVIYECERAVFHMEADQKGHQVYDWTILSNGVVIFSSTLEGDQFDYEVTRSAIVDQNLQFQLRTTNFANCESSLTTVPIVLPKTDVITAAFDVNPLVQKFPSSTVTITNNSSPGPWDFLWEFGDSETSSNASATIDHTYQTFGTFAITLTVSNDDCIKTATTTVQIDPPTPVLEFSYDPEVGCTPLTVNFTNLSQYADESSYEWDFGLNQGPSNAIHPTYTYYEPGEYTVTLKADNGFGETAQITKQLIIRVNEKPSAQFSVKPGEVQFPGGKLYTDNLSFGALSYLWDFGDGETSSDFEPVHLYETEGIFDLMLVATNADGCTDTARLESGARTVRSGQVLVPNAFSPNTMGPGGDGSGKNDFFMPMMRGVSEYQMMIFNRWGQLLFQTTDPDRGWDGYYQGKICPPDVYVYKISGRYSNGEILNRVGDVHLIR
jgi:gliding motility-associated-like protein